MPIRRLSYLFAIFVLLIFLVNAFSQTKKSQQKENSNQVKFAFQKGIYVGVAKNTTTKTWGDVEFSLINANKLSGEIQVSMSFTNGLCGDGEFEGIIDDTGVSLSGMLSCESRTMKMITRCSYVDFDTLSCEYKLLPNQKGFFNVTIQKLAVRESTVKNVQKRYDTSKSFPKNVDLDMAVVAVSETELREQPSEFSQLIKILKAGTLLVLVSREKSNNWYNVVDVESGRDGWISATDIDVRLAQNINPAPPQLEKNYVNSTSTPEVKIINNSNATLYLTFGVSKYIIAPYDSISFSISPGRYKFYASSPGILPDFGEDDIQVGYLYTWTFYIVTR